MQITLINILVYIHLGHLPVISGWGQGAAGRWEAGVGREGKGAICKIYATYFIFLSVKGRSTLMTNYECLQVFLTPLSPRD